MPFTVRIDVPLSFKAYRLSLLITIFYVQNQPTASQRTSQRGATRCFVKPFAKSLLSVRRASTVRRPRLKSPGPSSPLRPPTPHPSTRTSPSHTLCPPADAARVHVFLSAVSALCCTNRGRLPKVHAMRPRLIIILRRIVDPVHPRERRKRRKTKLAYEFGRLRGGDMNGAYFAHAIRDNECWIRR